MHAVRIQALLTLEALRWYPTLEPLIARLGLTGLVMDAKIHGALVRLTGLPMPPSPQIWKAWWEGDGARFNLLAGPESHRQLVPNDLLVSECSGDHGRAAFPGPFHDLRDGAASPVGRSGQHTQSEHDD